MGSTPISATGTQIFASQEFGFFIVKSQDSYPPAGGQGFNSHLRYEGLMAFFLFGCDRNPVAIL
jgi:hypothetical protein